jgi:hypothetical protein
MASGRQGSIGIGKETSFGTGVVPTAFFNATEGISEERGRLREAMNFGTRARQPADAGRLRISGPVSGLHARPANIGHLFRAALGAPVTTGSDAPYSHVFKPVATKFSTEAALPPYSLTVKRSASVIHRYAGGQLNRLVLNQPMDGALSIDTDWIAKSVSAESDTTMALEQGNRFLFKQLAVERDSSAWNYLESLTLTIDNALEIEEVLNESDEISATDFGDSNITVAMTSSFRDALAYADFKDNDPQAWEFEWTNGSAILTIVIPQLNIETWGAPIGGPGRMSVSCQGVAEFNTSAGYEMQVTLVNATASY